MPASVSVERVAVPREIRRVAVCRHMNEQTLICGVNWLGDSVMSMSAVQAFRTANPAGRIGVLAKRSLVPLWRMHAAVDEVLSIEPGVFGTLGAAQRVARQGFGRAYVFPNSFRSALIPFLGRIPERVGMRGHARSAMLTRVVVPFSEEGRRHQAWEYLAVMGLLDGPSAVTGPERARLRAPAEAMAQVRSRLAPMAKAGALVGLMPGAARGPAKRWAPARFAAVGRRLAEERGCRVVVLGSAAESELCAEVAQGVGRDVMNLAGQTSLPELTALLSVCRVVVANDSGGMHLAAAAGARVVAVFGMTDPAKTAPLGASHRVICPKGAQGSRDIKRNSAAARACLASIDADRVAVAALDLLSDERPCDHEL